jgi:hypothetical protein
MAVWKIGEILSVGKATTEALPYIRKAVSEGISANQTQRILSILGVGGRRVDILSAHKAFKYSYDNPSIYMPEDPSIRPNTARIPYAVREQNRPYRHIVTWYAQLPGEDSVVKHGITLDDDYALSRDEMLSQAWEIIVKSDIPESDVVDMEIDSITYSANPRFY